jgi:monoamine oxidase
MKNGIARRTFLARAVRTAAAMALLPTKIFGYREQLEHRGSPKKIIVIGAGLAGLSASFELTQAGHDVTILEAQTRPGGRAWSIRQPFSDNLYAEAGATTIVDTNDLTLKYASLFGLQLDSWDAP